MATRKALRRRHRTRPPWLRTIAKYCIVKTWTGGAWVVKKSTTRASTTVITVTKHVHTRSRNWATDIATFGFGRVIIIDGTERYPAHMQTTKTWAKEPATAAVTEFTGEPTRQAEPIRAWAVRLDRDNLFPRRRSGVSRLKMTPEQKTTRTASIASAREHLRTRQLDAIEASVYADAGIPIPDTQTPKETTAVAIKTTIDTWSNSAGILTYPGIQTNTQIVAFFAACSEGVGRRRGDFAMLDGYFQKLGAPKPITRAAGDARTAVSRLSEQFKQVEGAVQARWANVSGLDFGPANSDKHSTFNPRAVSEWLDGARIIAHPGALGVQSEPELIQWLSRAKNGAADLNVHFGLMAEYFGRMQLGTDIQASIVQLAATAHTIPIAFAKMHSEAAATWGVQQPNFAAANGR